VLVMWRLLGPAPDPQTAAIVTTISRQKPKSGTGSMATAKIRPSVKKSHAADQKNNSGAHWNRRSWAAFNAAQARAMFRGA
jgi:hypothetical protein